MLAGFVPTTRIALVTAGLAFAVLGLAVSLGATVLLLVILAIFYSKRRAPELVACVLYFGVLGSLIGSVVFWLMIAVGQYGWSLRSVFGSLFLGMAFSVLSVPIGAPPAMLTGVIYWALRRSASTMYSRAFSMAVAVMTGGVSSVLWFVSALEGDIGLLWEAEYWRSFAPLGGVAAFLCAVIVAWRVFSPKRAAVGSAA